MNCLRSFPCAACNGTGTGRDCPVCDTCLGAGVVYVTVRADEPPPARVGGTERRP